jgi:hypothetical protein
MTGLVPAIYPVTIAAASWHDPSPCVDARHKAGHDGYVLRAASRTRVTPSRLDQRSDGGDESFRGFDGHRGVLSGNPQRRLVGVIGERFQIVCVGQKLRESWVELRFVLRQPREDGAKAAVGFDRASGRS